MNAHAAELRRFIADARARISPQSLGFPATGRRRVPGLRREEVAELIGVSDTWYARFESGRATLSTSALMRLADALLLTAAERSRLLQLARPELSAIAGVSRPALPAHASKQIRAFSAFLQHAPSASSTWELTALALNSISSGVASVALTSCLMRTTAGRWLHRSEERPDVADVLNSAILDDDGMRSACFGELAHVDAVGGVDHAATGHPYLRMAGSRSLLKSGFGIRVPMSDSYVGFSRVEVGFPDDAEILLVAAVATTTAMMMRGEF